MTRSVLVIGLALLAGCARYDALPLPAGPSLAPDLAALDHAGVDIATPLGADAVARFAVLNNPDLRAARLQERVAAAQTLEAGLLPNPQFTPSTLANVVAPNALDSPWTLALAIDVKAIVERPSRARAARFAARQVDASALWQEWQVIGRARLLVVQVVEGERDIALLRREVALFRGRRRASEAAVRAGDATIATAVPDLAAEESAVDALATADATVEARWAALDALLGLAPEVRFALRPVNPEPAPNPAAIREALATLPVRRPDLLALRYGYAAADAQLRTAIVGQFPALIVSLAGGEDNTRNYGLGPQPTIDLPIFNHNQGQIAIARATRAQLRAAYAARLDAAAGEVRALVAALATEEGALVTARAGLPPLVRADADADAMLRAGNLDERSAVDIAAARLAREQQIATLEQAILAQEVAIATVTGAGLPRASFAGDPLPAAGAS